MKRIKSSSQSVAVIGGGLSGTLLTINLILNARKPVQIFLIESKQKRIGRGIAYSPNSIYQILNVPAKKMGLYSDKPSHFFDWWQRVEKNYFYLNEEYNENSFFPRFIYGDYVESILAESIQNKPNFIDFYHINDEAIDVTYAIDRWQIKLASESEINVKSLVLATGNISPANPSYIAKEVLTNKRYIENPWNETVYDSINTTERIGILGSGLSMVDVLMTLRRKGFRGSIVSFSRSGKLPKVHEKIGNANPTNHPQPSGILRKDFINIRNWIGSNIKVSDEAILNNLRPAISKFWQSWNTKDQLRFLRHVRPFWESFRHRIPQESMNVILDWKEKNSLDFIKGKILKTKIEDGVLQIEHSNKSIYCVDKLINCTGPDTQIKQVKSLLYSNLLEKGYISTSPNGIGFKTIELGKVVPDDGAQDLDRIYAIGPLRKNDLWESTAVNEIRSQVEELSVHLLNEQEVDSNVYISGLKKFKENIVQLVPTPEAIPNLPRIFDIYSTSEIINLVANTIGWVRPSVGYSRLKLMSNPFEILMLVWSPQSETAIHKHVGFGGILLVLQGELIERKFVINNCKMELSEETYLQEKQSALESINSIHQVKNVSLDSYTISLHLYYPTLDSLTSMEIFDLQNQRKGVLNENAKAASWEEKGSSFKMIGNME
ncbi:FAD/NAD(P)-binding protein [Leptospira sp. 96542]|nr:FAD/NAD(P)-binding protein [Leptospira sp. 96542]